jgi:hypothetical protein
MYICAKCDTEVAQPGNRWWSGWRYCANGHVLYVGGLGPSFERSFWTAFLRAFARSFLFFCVVVITASTAPDNASMRSEGPAMGFLVAAFYLVAGLILLIRAQAWARLPGAIQRLLPHAKGRGCGFLAAAACQLGITVAVVFAK